jgi:glycosyltransferase involved in cell wall biosynthesis
MNGKGNIIDILIPTYGRRASLAVTLASLIGQTNQDWRVVISDQNDIPATEESGELRAVIRVLELMGHTVEYHHHLPRRGMAEQRQFLLNQAHAPYVLYLDDDVILEPWVIDMMLKQLEAEGCGFVGCSVIGTSYIPNERPDQQEIEFWEAGVQPEKITVGSPEWFRHRLNNAANIYLIQQKYRAVPSAPLKYKVAWVAVSVLYDAAKLRDVGGFRFWVKLPDEHCGEDVLAQLRVMAKFGGCGLLPSGVYHQELETTIKNREVDAPKSLTLYIDEPVHQEEEAQ